MNKFIVALIIIFCCLEANANVLPNSLFTDHMVLQRNQPLPVWGTASEGELVTVEFDGQSVSTRTINGRWRFKLKKHAAGGPYKMIIKGRNNTVIVSDILVGEVWICSGQSNMEWSLFGAKNGEQEIAAADYPLIRQFRVPWISSPEPMKESTGNWSVCSPETANQYTAVGYFFARRLYKKLNVPIGILFSAVGGTPAQCWAPENSLKAVPQLKGLVDSFHQDVKTYAWRLATFRKNELLLRRQYTVDSAKAAQEGKAIPWPVREPYDPYESVYVSCLYNAMIAPLAPYAIKGVCWYQGESNDHFPEQYIYLLSTLIESWRAKWGLGNFPFLVVQIAPSNAWLPEIRESQRIVVDHIKNTALISTMDCGDSTNIHPPDKAPVGDRLALAASALAYGENVEYQGPSYENYSRKGDTLVLHFTHVGAGLQVHGNALSGFMIAGKDSAFVPASAAISGKDILIWNFQIHEPQAGRYGWEKFPIPSFYNKEGLPASPFQTYTGKMHDLVY